MEIAAVSLDDAGVRRLIDELNRELAERYPEEGATHFRLDAEELAPGRGVLLVARVDGEAAACGAVRRIDGGRVEIKRMYTRPAARGGGLARALLAELERRARDELGARELVLETGTRQHEAIALYERAGFRRIDAFGEYVGSPLSVCMSKSL